MEEISKFFLTDGEKDKFIDAISLNIFSFLFNFEMVEFIVDSNCDFSELIFCVAIAVLK